MDLSLSNPVATDSGKFQIANMRLTGMRASLGTHLSLVNCFSSSNRELKQAAEMRSRGADRVSRFCQH